jgi:hypothetical protein
VGAAADRGTQDFVFVELQLIAFGASEHDPTIVRENPVCMYHKAGMLRAVLG